MLKFGINNDLLKYVPSPNLTLKVTLLVHMDIIPCQNFITHVVVTTTKFGKCYFTIAKNLKYIIQVQQGVVENNRHPETFY